MIFASIYSILISEFKMAYFLTSTHVCKLSKAFRSCFLLLFKPTWDYVTDWDCHDIWMPQ